MTVSLLPLTTVVTSTFFPAVQRVVAVRAACCAVTVTVASTGWRESSCAVPATVNVPGCAYCSAGTSSHSTGASSVLSSALTRWAVAGSCGAVPAGVLTSIASTERTARSGAYASSTPSYCSRVTGTIVPWRGRPPSLFCGNCDAGICSPITSQEEASARSSVAIGT